VIIIALYCVQNINLHPEIGDQIKTFDMSAIPLFFGVAVFDFEGNGTVINLYASMKEPKKFNYVLVTTTALYALIVCAFSSLAYRVRYRL
jgi:amino acid permease